MSESLNGKRLEALMEDNESKLKIGEDEMNDNFES